MFFTLLQDRNLLGDSVNWKNWMSVLKMSTCRDCAKKHGTVYPISTNDYINCPAHTNCLCKIVSMRTKLVGTATENGKFGADVYLTYTNRLPDYYISMEDAKAVGWIPAKGNLHSVAPNTMIFGGRFLNTDGKLPTAKTRIWYEADINYSGGYRGHDRILFSNDGLLFATYDHYKTFYEIVK